MRNFRYILAAFILFSGIVVLTATYYVRRHQLRQRPVLSTPSVSSKDRTPHSGDRVRIASWAGTFKPEETGLKVEIDADCCHTGTLLRADSQIVRVRWDAQSWKENGVERQIPLGTFDATIHVSYLEVVP